MHEVASVLEGRSPVSPHQELNWIAARHFYPGQPIAPESSVSLHRACGVVVVGGVPLATRVRLRGDVGVRVVVLSVVVVVVVWSGVVV